MYSSWQGDSELQSEKVKNTQEIENIGVNQLKGFKNHPFKVETNRELFELMQSIERNGILVPLLARPSPDGNGYELISGHRRKAACEWAGITEVPVIICDMDDNQATIAMVNSNLQREHVKPSEKAFAFKMRLEAMKRQGERSDLTSSQLGTKSDIENPTVEINKLELVYDSHGVSEIRNHSENVMEANMRSDDLLAKQVGESRNQIARYIRLILDESHNAGSELSVEMLNNLNPSLVLDLTATPRKNSNIISYVDARELKKERMVKLPVVVYNRTSRQSVIQDAIQLRGSIEQQAIAEEQAGGNYIRPIVLFQAQPKTNENSETFDKIKTLLIEMGIPEDEIAVKTSKVDDLGTTNLMSKACPIRYIITVNALKEGWDCPFAYILASLANKTSTVDVEQILGRILRQPYTKQHTAPLLNTSYVLTCSNDFHNTLENIVIGLNKAGFSRKDFRVGEMEEKQTDTTQEVTYEQARIEPEQQVEESNDTFEDIVPAEVKSALETVNASNEPTPSITDMIQTATQQAKEYDEVSAENNGFEFTGGELGDMLQQNKIQTQFRGEAEKIRVPQFFLKTVPDLFGDEYELLEPENLSDGFSLSGQDANVSVELATGEMYRVDIQEQGEAVPKYKRASKEESEYIREYLAKLPPEKKIAQCTDMICHQLNKNNRYATSEITDYVQRIVSNMSDDEITAMESAIPVYAHKIQQKIDTLEENYREQQFFNWLDSGKIVCKENYALPEVITPAYTTDAIPYSLYEAEKDDMNNFENSLIDVVVGFDNIRWWHRIIERKDLRLNGYINHYPDFMVMTKSDNIVLIEAKGDYLDGDDSKSKLKLGRQWQAHAGRMYRYFMVFKDKELGVDGAYTLDKFAKIMKDL